MAICFRLNKISRLKCISCCAYAWYCHANIFKKSFLVKLLSYCEYPQCYAKRWWIIWDSIFCRNVFSSPHTINKLTKVNISDACLKWWLVLKSAKKTWNFWNFWNFLDKKYSILIRIKFLFISVKLTSSELMAFLQIIYKYQIINKIHQWLYSIEQWAYFFFPPRTAKSVTEVLWYFSTFLSCFAWMIG